MIVNMNMISHTSDHLVFIFTPKTSIKNYTYKSCTNYLNRYTKKKNPPYYLLPLSMFSISLKTKIVVLLILFSWFLTVISL